MNEEKIGTCYGLVSKNWQNHDESQLNDDMKKMFHTIIKLKKDTKLQNDGRHYWSGSTYHPNIAAWMWNKKSFVWIKTKEEFLLWKLKKLD